MEPKLTGIQLSVQDILDTKVKIPHFWQAILESV